MAEKFEGEVLSKKAFIALDDRRYTTVDVLGVKIRLRSITTGEFFEGQHWAAKETKRRLEEEEVGVNSNFVPIVQMLCDENDKPMFGNSLRAGYEAITAKSKGFINALSDECNKFLDKKIDLGFKPEEAIEELAGNSETPPDTISSSSPSASAE